MTDADPGLSNDGLVRLWKCREDFLRDVRAKDLLPFLRQGAIVSLEDEETIMHEVTTRSRTDKLLWILLAQIDDGGAFRCLEEALDETYPHIAQLLAGTSVSAADETDFRKAITDHAQAVRAGTRRTLKYDVPDSPDLDVVSVTEAELRHIYLHQLAYLAPVPWNEAFRVPMGHVFTSLCTVNIAQPQWGSKSLHELVRGLHEEGIGTEDLLGGAACGRAVAQHIVVEGEPGIGKTTLCHKLAYDWSIIASEAASVSNSDGASGIHRFQMVFFLEARRLEEDSLLDCIYTSLLPEDFAISKEMLEQWLEKPEVQSKVLFIIDAYDEISKSNEQLTKLIERRIYSRCSLIVTTRPTYANSIIAHFDAGYVILGYPFRKRKEFIRKYVEETKADIKIFRTLEHNLLENDTVSDLSRNPLYLWFLCMLVEDNDGQLPETRTQLFEEVVDLLMRKARVRLSLSEEACSAYFGSLCQLAFESHKEGKVHFNNAVIRKYFASKDASLLGRIGFLSREMSSSRLRPSLLYTFTHKTIQEFLAANHLVSLPTDKRVSFVHRRRKDRLWWMVWIFLSGLLQGDDEALETHYRSAVCKDLSASVTSSSGMSSDDHVHNTYHLGLQCLGESGLFATFSSLASLIVPSAFVYSVMACHYCLQGFVIAHSNGAPGHRPDLVINGLDLETHQMFDYKLLDAVRACENLESLVLTEVMSVNLLLDYLTKFCSSKLELRRLYIYLSPIVVPGLHESGYCIQDLRQAYKSVNSLETLVFKGSGSSVFKGAESLAQGLEMLLILLLSNIGPRLRILVLNEQTMTAMPTSALLNCLHHCINLTNIHLEYVRFAEGQFEALIQALSDCARLCSLYIVYCLTENTEGPVVAHLPDNFPHLLQSCPLEELTLHSCGGKTNEAMRAIVETLREKSTLRTFELINWRLGEQTWKALNCTLDTLRRLKKLTLCDIGINQEQIVAFSQTLVHLTSLESLDLSTNDLGTSEVVHQLTTSIQELKNLRTLEMNNCQIGDDSIHLLRVVFEKIPLRNVSFIGNPLGESEQGIDGLLKALEVSCHIDSLSLTCTRFTPKIGLSLAMALTKNERIRQLNVLSIPTPELMTCDSIKSLYKSICETLPSLETFSRGFNANLRQAHLWRKTDHAYYRKLCLGNNS